MWGFDVYMDPSGAYRWRLWSAAGRWTGSCADAFKARYNAHRAAERFRDGARELAYETLRDGEAGHRWVARTPDGEVVAASARVYPTDDEARKAAEEVRVRAGNGRIG